MKFHLGEVPPTPNFRPDESWRRLKEPNVWLLQLIATPIGFAAAGFMALLWLRFTPLMGFGLTANWTTIVVIILTFVGVICVHELLHAAAHPHFGFSDRTVIGFWPSRVVFYAAYLGPIPRNRFLLILFLPLAVLSILMFVVGTVLPASNLLLWMAFVSIGNVMLASGDLFALMAVSVQLPAEAVICNQGWRSYWRIGR